MLRLARIRRLAANSRAFAFGCLLAAAAMPPGLNGESRQIHVPPGMVLVPEGWFLMGSDRGNPDEAPRHRVFLSAYLIDKYEVTNADFCKFVRETNAFRTIEGPWFRTSLEGALDLLAFYEREYGVALEPFEEAFLKKERFYGIESQRYRDRLRWRAAAGAIRYFLSPRADLSIEADTLRKDSAVKSLVAAQRRLPVRNVSWRDARAYAAWAGKRLPTEAEWEKAARGTDGRTYPWGNTWDPARCRAGLKPAQGPRHVGSFPSDASPYGCLDMAGNVWEWVADWYGENTYRSGENRNPTGPKGLPEGRLPGPDGKTNLLGDPRQGRESNTRKVLRGGGYAGERIGFAQYNTRCARRAWSNPNYWSPDTGFRCAKDLE